MKQNNFNRLPTYGYVNKRLQYMLKSYLMANNGDKIKAFNLAQRKNNGEFENRLIENDFDSFKVVKEIKESYFSRDYLEGEIGITDGEEQYDGILNIALYTLMTNRVGKMFLNENKQNFNLDKDTKNNYNDYYRKLMLEKDDATIKLIYSLFIYKETKSEEDYDFSYGHNIDKDGNDNIVIDLPVYGQMSVHFAKKDKAKDVLERMTYEATKTAQAVLDRKLELGQITNEEYEKIQNKLDNGEIFPEYRGKLYEYSSGIPIDYRGKKFDEAQKHFGLNGKWPDEVDGDLKQENKRKVNVNEIGKEAVSQTTAEERQVVARHEQNIENSRQSNIKTEEIGGK